MMRIVVMDSDSAVWTWGLLFNPPSPASGRSICRIEARKRSGTLPAMPNNYPSAVNGFDAKLQSTSTTPPRKTHQCPRSATPVPACAAFAPVYRIKSQPSLFSQTSHKLHFSRPRRRGATVIANPAGTVYTSRRQPDISDTLSRDSARSSTHTHSPGKSRKYTPCTQSYP